MSKKALISREVRRPAAPALVYHTCDYEPNTLPTVSDLNDTEPQAPGTSAAALPHRLSLLPHLQQDGI